MQHAGPPPEHQSHQNPNIEMSLREQLLANSQPADPRQSYPPPPSASAPGPDHPYQSSEPPQRQPQPPPHPQPHPSQIDPNVTGEDPHMAGYGMAGEGGSADDPTGKSKRELSTSKRAAQNRAAQRAFRQRKEGYIKKLEEQVKELQTMEHNFRSLQNENYQLREYILNLQSRLLENSSDFPPAPSHAQIVDRVETPPWEPPVPQPRLAAQAQAQDQRSPPPARNDDSAGPARRSPYEGQAHGPGVVAAGQDPRPAPRAVDPVQAVQAELSAIRQERREEAKRAVKEEERLRELRARDAQAQTQAQAQVQRQGQMQGGGGQSPTMVERLGMMSERPLQHESPYGNAGEYPPMPPAKRARVEVEQGPEGHGSRRMGHENGQGGEGRRDEAGDVKMGEDAKEVGREGSR